MHDRRLLTSRQATNKLHLTHISSSEETSGDHFSVSTADPPRNKIIQNEAEILGDSLLCQIDNIKFILFSVPRSAPNCGILVFISVTLRKYILLLPQRQQPDEPGVRHGFDSLLLCQGTPPPIFHNTTRIQYPCRCCIVYYAYTNIHGNIINWLWRLQ